MRYILNLKVFYLLILILVFTSLSYSQEKKTLVNQVSSTGKTDSRPATKPIYSKSFSSKKPKQKSTSFKVSKKLDKKQKINSGSANREETSQSEGQSSEAENKMKESETSNSAETTPKEAMKEGERLPFMQKQNLPSTVQNNSSGSIWTKTFGALLIVLGVLFFGVWGLKKFGILKPMKNALENSPELSILSSVSLQAGQTISIVRFGKQTLLVGSTAQSFTLLADTEEMLFGDKEKLESMIQEQNEKFDFETKPRSVSELLAEENYSFNSELKKAENHFSDLKNFGGNY